MGHQIVVLIGNFTAKIGDPTDKSAARSQQTDEQVAHNMREYLKQLAPIINFNDKVNPVQVRYNADWLSKMTFEDVITLASHFTVQQMLERDMFEKRIEEGKPIYLHEFMYPLMQGYDSVALEVDMEIGGNDQTFNMLAGRTLEDRMLHKDKMVLTCELLVDAEGKKMSKTDNNFVALANSPEDMFGKIMSWNDSVMENALRILTDLTEEEIKVTLAKEPRDAKLDLAYEVTKIYKGEAGANVARGQFIEVFSKGAKPADIETKTTSEKNIIEAIVAVGLVSSKSEARRVIDQKGLKVNDEVVESYEYELEKGTSLVQKGKRHFLNIQVN
jgi:tyrosyl-tRNA synthetase